MYKTPQHYYDSGEVQFECPLGHTTKRHPENADVRSPIPAFEGHCPDCLDRWRDYHDNHDGDFTDQIDNDFPDDPTFMEIIVQRVVDWRRAKADTVDDPEEMLPSRSDFGGTVTWVMSDPDRRPPTGGDWDV